MKALLRGSAALLALSVAAAAGAQGAAAPPPPDPARGAPADPPGAASIAPVSATIAPASTAIAPGSAGAIAPASTAIAPGSGASIAPVSTAIAPADTGRELVFLVPAEVTGSSDGAALARVGFGVLAGFGEATDPTGWDVSAVIEAEVATHNGLATLIGLNAEGDDRIAPIGSLRLSTSFARLDFEGEGGSAYPPLILYAGGSIGRTELRYLGRGPARRDTTLPPTFERRELTAVPWSVGAAAVYIADGWSKLAPTFEGQIAFESRWTPSPDTLSWCEPVGDIVRGVDPSTGATVYDTASRCDRMALGAPVNSKELSIAAQLGLVDKVANATFRASLGARISIALNDDAPADVVASVRAPVYVTLARAPEGTKYRGMIRLMPALNITRLSTGETGVGGVLALSFLGQRAMFSDDYNDL